MTNRLNKYRDLALIVGLFVAFRLMWLMALEAGDIQVYRRPSPYIACHDERWQS